MIKELLKELKEELEGNETTLLDLDNYIMTKGFYSVYDDGQDVIDDIIENQVVLYTSIKTGECELRIEFELNPLDIEFITITEVSEF
jgi:predicted HAD superfamily phosphohydrolase YqeG